MYAPEPGRGEVELELCRGGGMNKYKKIKLKNGSTIDEHRLIANVTGFNTVVHHIDGDKSNNKPENLQIMSRSEHAKLHGLGKKINGNKTIFGPDSEGMAICMLCGKRLIWEKFIL